MRPIDKITARLDQCKKTGGDKWLACCPSHDDRTPSLTIKETESGKVLLHCFGGCAPVEVLDAIGLSLGDLFTEPLEPVHRPRRHTTPTEDEFFLAICRSSRAKGKRLTSAEKQQEREAFMRTRSIER